MLNLNDVLALLLAFCLMLFIIWNNWPDLVERIGIFLIAHAQAIQARKGLVVSIRKRCET